MDKTAAQIAMEALLRTSTLRRQLRAGVDGMKMAAKKDEPPLGLPATLGAGVGVGTVGGGGMGVLSNVKNLLAAAQLKSRLPQLEAQRKGLEQAGLGNRKVLGELLRSGKLSNPQYYNLRRGYEKGLVERSRTAKTLNALKKLTRKSMLRKTLLGAGAGLGTGLLASTAFGHFD